MASLVDAKDTPDTTAFVVELTHAELLAAEAGDEAVIASCLGRIATAYGPDGIGLLTVSGVPGVIAAREKSKASRAAQKCLESSFKCVLWRAPSKQGTSKLRAQRKHSALYSAQFREKLACTDCQSHLRIP